MKNISVRSFLLVFLLLLLSLQGRPGQPWDIVFSFPGKAPFEGGIATDGRYLYTTVGVKYPCPLSTPFFHQYALVNEQWTCVDSFNIPGYDGKPIITQELAYDGRYFYCMNEDGDSILILDFINRTLAGATGLTGISGMNKVEYFPEADNGNGGFFVTNGENLYLVNKSGIILKDLSAHLTSPLGKLRWINGLAVDDFTAGGPFLWIFDETFTFGSPPLYGPILWQYSLANDTLTGTYHEVNDIPGMDPSTWYGAAGLCLDKGNLAGGKLSLIGVLNPFVQSLVFAYQLNDTSLQTIIRGRITDDSTGNPLPYHALTIFADTLSGCLYNRQFLTGHDGQFTDTVLSLKNMKMWIRTMDCLDHSLDTSFYTSSAVVVKDFVICDSAHGQIPQAGFSYYLDSISSIPRLYRFDNTSVGSPDWYRWQFGDGTFSMDINPVHLYNYPGTYTVCLVAGKGTGPGHFEDSTCRVIHTPSYYLIGGLLFAGNSPINNPVSTGDTGIAMLYRKQGTSYIPVDTSSFTEFGYYYFMDRLPGRYIIKARLTAGSAHFPDYFPSYFTSAFEWKIADEVLLGDSSLYESSVFMNEVPGLPSAGPCTISGSVIQVFKSSGSSGPYLADQEVILTDMNGNPLTFCFSDASGGYSFNNLPYGDYRLFAEVTGMDHDWAVVSLKPSAPDTDNVFLHVFNSAVGIEEVASKDDIILYPNPVTDILHIRSGTARYGLSGTVTVRVADMTGRILMERSENGTNPVITLPVERLEPGSYILILNFRDDPRRVMKPFIKI